jgi:hypothetical protein
MKRRNKRGGFPVLMEHLESRQLLSAELVPDTAEFGTAMVFNKAKSTFQVTKPDQTTFLPTDTIYVYAGWKNTGDPVAGIFRVDFAIYVDDVLADSDFFAFSNGDPLGTNASFARINFVAGKLGVGTHTIKLVIDTENAVAEGNEGNNIETRQITVTGDPASKVAFVGGVKPTTAGETIAPVKVKVTNNKNQPIFNETVSLAIFSGPNGATLLGTVTGTTDNKGIVTFSDLELETAGTYKLVATDGPLTSSASAPFKISPAALSTLEFDHVIPSEFAGDTFNTPIAVKAADAFGNLISGKTIKLAIATGPVGGKIYGSISGVTNASGIASFKTTSFRIAGDYTLEASNLFKGILTTGTSNSFNIHAASMAKILFTQLPVGAVHGVETTVIGQLADAYGNPVSNNLLDMGISIVAKPAGALLLATYNQPMVNGAATFDDVVFSKAGKYSVRLSVAIYSSVSGVFTVL